MKLLLFSLILISSINAFSNSTSSEAISIPLGIDIVDPLEITIGVGDNKIDFGRFLETSYASSEQSHSSSILVTVTGSSSNNLLPISLYFGDNILNSFDTFFSMSNGIDTIDTFFQLDEYSGSLNGGSFSTNMTATIPSGGLTDKSVGIYTGNYKVGVVYD